MTNEGLIDRRIDQAVEWANSSQTYVKYTAIAAAQVVGTYSGTTEVIAQRTKRQVSTVQNWAHAFNLYEHERGNNRPIARHLWRELPISFWWIAWDFHNRGYEALEYLLQAYQNGWSTRDMREEFKRDVEAGTAPLQRKRLFVTVRGMAEEILEHFAEDVTTEVYEALQIIVKELSE